MDQITTNSIACRALTHALATDSCLYLQEYDGYLQFSEPPQPQFNSMALVTYAYINFLTLFHGSRSPSDFDHLSCADRLHCQSRPDSTQATGIAHAPPQQDSSAVEIARVWTNLESPMLKQWNPPKAAAFRTPWTLAGNNAPGEVPYNSLAPPLAWWTAMT